MASVPDVPSADAILSGDRQVLARAITLVESTRPEDRRRARVLLDELLPATGKALRVGITGVPGVGKSTFIEALGKQLTGAGHRIAVLAVDPSSALTGGSILGDKTRMTELARDDRAFIRPSPGANTPGGVARRTREAGLLCEASGCDVILVETIGVGQSETAVADMVDTFVLLQLHGAGDELQGIKRGVMEMADVIVLNKADGEGKAAAQALRERLAAALALLPPHTPGWRAPVQCASARTGAGLEATWIHVLAHRRHLEEQDLLGELRREQALAWFRGTLRDLLEETFRATPKVAQSLPILESQVRAGTMDPTTAAAALIAQFRGQTSEGGD